MCRRRAPALTPGEAGREGAEEEEVVAEGGGGVSKDMAPDSSAEHGL